MNIIEKIKNEFRSTNILNKIIYVNVFIFLLVNILSVISNLFLFSVDSYIEKLMLPSETSQILKQPWSFLTYIFLHNSFLHLLFNMIWLHFGGNLFLQYLNEKQFLNIYILGGVFGGLLFVMAFNYLPALQQYNEQAKALGASASVLAIFFAIATKIPNYHIKLPFIGFIKLRYLAIFFILLDFLSIPKGNAGGHIAHIGGALFGFAYIKQLNKTKSSIFDQILNMFKFTKKKKEKKEINEVDVILEKISKSGYNSLNENEKNILFKSSKK